MINCISVKTIFPGQTERIMPIIIYTKAIVKNPLEGIGTELLKYDLAGYWSRRIDHEHRFVYTIDDGVLIIQSLRGHY